MNEDVLLRLAIAKQYAHHANFAGTPRQAIADGYIDAMFSALFLHSGQEPSRNHKQKFDDARKQFPQAFMAETVKRGNSWSFSPGADWASLEEYYKEWLASRYDKFDLDAGVASCRVREARAAVSAGIRFLAKKENMYADELDALACERAFGFKFSQTSAAVSDVHDLLFHEAEELGDAQGSKLGTKLAATTNYCDLDLTAGDALTQKIILEDLEVAEDAARLYHLYVRLVDKIQEKRLGLICGGKPIEECTPEQIIDTFDFMLSLKARYHGGTIPIVGVAWSKALKGVLSCVSHVLKQKVSDLAGPKKETTTPAA
ncbi:hypothetical protein ABIF79_011956 [Bradyrhizobium japonicum]